MVEQATNWRNPLHVALCISPLVLLLGIRLSNMRFSRLFLLKVSLSQLKALVLYLMQKYRLFWFWVQIVQMRSAR